MPAGSIPDSNAPTGGQCLDFNFEHQIKAYSREELEYLYYYLCKIMFKGAENPGSDNRRDYKLI